MIWSLEIRQNVPSILSTRLVGCSKAHAPGRCCRNAWQSFAHAVAVEHVINTGVASHSQRHVQAEALAKSNAAQEAQELAEQASTRAREMEAKGDTAAAAKFKDAAATWQKAAKEAASEATQHAEASLRLKAEGEHAAQKVR